MSEIHRFRALRPPQALAREVACVPYDVINTDEARALAAGKERSYLHVIRPEIDLPPETGPYDDEVYDQGARNFHRFLSEGWLQEDQQAGYLLYRLIREGRSQTGVVACCSVDEYDDDRIVKHERTRPDKEDDRTRHVLTLSAHAEPVLLAHPPHAALSTYLEQGTTGEPIYDFTADDGIRHTVWQAPDPERLAGLYAELPALYVADGHHRSASASRARATRRDANPGHSGGEEYNHFLATVFPADQLHILAYNRVVKDLNGRTADELLAALRKSFTVTEEAPPVPANRGDVSVRLDGRWFGLRLFADGERPADPVETLDISRLQDGVLSPLLGIEDPRTDKRIGFVGGSRGAEELARRVGSDCAVAFSMFPTSMEELMAVADAGRVMPPKSTWFEPKLRSGLFVHRF